MKGLVLEVKNNETAILREDGIVVKIKGVYQVGETIQLGEVSSFPSKSRNSKGTINSFLRLAVAAALIIVLSFGGYNYAAVMAETYVTIDDPTDGVSIEYVLNRLNKVVSINAYNKAGEDVKAIIEKDVKGLSISEALDVYNKASSDSSSPKVYSVTSKSEKKGQSI